MKIRYFALTICFSLLCCLSCTRNERQHETITPLNDSPLEVDLYDLVDTVLYVPLETSDSCLLGDVIQAKKIEGYYVVRDNSGVYTFDEDGCFVSEIGRKGRGEHEYISLNNFYVDERRRLIGLICNASSKVMYYTYDGKYEYTIPISKEDSGMSFMSETSDGNLLAYYPLPNDIDDVQSEYKRIYKDGGKLRGASLLPMKDVTTKDVLYSFFSYPMVNHHDSTLLLSVLSHDVYAYRGGQLHCAYRFDLPKALPDDGYLERYEKENFYEVREKIKRDGMSVGLTAIQSDGDYLFLSVNDEYMLVWDGGRCVLVGMVHDEGKNQYFPNLALSGGCSDDCLGAYHAYDILQMKVAPHCRNRAFRELAKSISAHDNPVLYRFVFKKDLVDRLADEYGL